MFVLIVLFVMKRMKRYYTFFRIAIMLDVYISLIPHSILQTDCVDMWSWIDAVRRNMDTEGFEMFVYCCWHIWRNRNSKVHDNKTLDPLEAISVVHNSLDRFKEARQMYSSTRSPAHDLRWVPPSDGLLKLNFDASSCTR